MEGLRGEDLDRALVRLEQQHVQRLTDQYFKDRPKAERKTIMESISRASDPTGIGGMVRSDLLGVGNNVVEDAMRAAFPRGSYDFSNPEHRIRLGYKMLEIVNRQDRSAQRSPGR